MGVDHALGLVAHPPWKKPLPVYISSPAPERAQTQALSASTEQPFMSPHTVYLPLLTILPPQTQPLDRHTHTHTHIMKTDRYIIHVTATPVLLNHSPPFSPFWNLFFFFLPLSSSFFFPCVFHHSPF